MSTRTQAVYLTAPSRSVDAVEVHTDLGLIRVNVNVVDAQTGLPVVLVEFEPAQGKHARTRHRGLPGDFDVRLEDKILGPADG